MLVTMRTVAIVFAVTMQILLYNSTLHLLDNTSTVAAQPLNAIKVLLSF